MSLCQVQGNKLVVGARRQMRGLLDSCIISIITIHQFSSSLSCACVIISFLSDFIREIASQIVFVAIYHFLNREKCVHARIFLEMVLKLVRIPSQHLTSF